MLNIYVLCVRKIMFLVHNKTKNRSYYSIGGKHDTLSTLQVFQNNIQDMFCGYVL